MIIVDGSTGSQLTMTDPAAIAAALMHGSSVLRTNGTFAVLQTIGSDLSKPASWIVDGVPLTASTATPPPPTQPAAPQQPAAGSAPTIYRMALQSPDGTYATGANYPGCSPNNPGACDPQQLPDLTAVMNYAASKHETPILITSPDEAWAIVDGKETPAPSQLITGSLVSSFFQNPVAWLVGAWAAWKFLK